MTCLGNVSKVSCDFFFPSSRAWSDMCVDGVCLSVFIPVTARPVFFSKATLLPDALALVPHISPARPRERPRRATEGHSETLRELRVEWRMCVLRNLHRPVHVHDRLGGLCESM